MDTSYAYKVIDRFIEDTKSYGIVRHGQEKIVRDALRVLMAAINGR